VEGTNIYAIIETGGKQYRITQGQTVDVDNLNVIDGDTIEFDKVLVIGDEKNATIGAPNIEGAKVTATSKGTVRGDKSLSTNSNQRSDSARRPDIINCSHAWPLIKLKHPESKLKNR